MIWYGIRYHLDRLRYRGGLYCELARSGVLWLLVGLLLGPVGLLMSFAAGTGRKCQFCMKNIAVKAVKCPYCRSDLTTRVPVSASPQWSPVGIIIFVIIGALACANRRNCGAEPAMTCPACTYTLRVFLNDLLR